MTNKTRKQHYIWRDYLRAWAQDEKIHAYFKDSNKFIISNLMGVGQQRDFYHVSTMTEYEYKYTEELIKLNTKDESLELFYLKNFQNMNLILKNAKENQSNDFISRLETTVFNLGEMLQSQRETIGAPYLEKLRKGDATFFLDIDSRIEFFIYLSMQYFRTKSMRERIIKSIGKNNKDMNIEKMWKTLQITYSERLAKGLAIGEPIKITLYHNDKNNFITSDQPVVNLRQETDQDGIAKFLELYYPISPTFAICIAPNDKYEVINENISIEKVQELNNFQIKNCLNQVYSNNKEIIKQYIPDPIN